MKTKVEAVADPQEPDRGGGIELVDEIREVNTVFDSNEIGVPRITVHRQRLPDGGQPQRNLSGPLRVSRTAMDDVRDRTRERDELLELARRDIVPAVAFHEDAMVCRAFQGFDGQRAPIGAATWCQGSRCPSWAKDGTCAADLLSTRPMLVRIVRPATMAEYEQEAAKPGASIAADYQARLDARVAELATERTARKRAADQAREAAEAQAAARAKASRTGIHFDRPADSAEARSLLRQRVR